MTRTQPAAFTLVEFLVASVLASVLVVTLLLVLGSLSRDQQNTGQTVDASALNRELIRLVRNDLLAATTLTRAPGQGNFVLVGHAGLEAATLRPSQRVAKVSYQLVDAGGRRWLTRQQQNLSAGTTGHPWSELVCSGIRSIELAGADLAAPGQQTALPAQVRLVVHWEDQRRSPLDEQIILRGPKE